MNRGLLLFCVLLLGLTSLSARAITRSENCVGGSPNFLPNFTFADAAQPAAASGENEGCDYDFASGVHKYLYAQDDPVNHIDPSGHGLADLMLTINIQVYMAAARLAPVVTAARYASTVVFVARLTFDQEFRDNAGALGPDALLAASGEFTAVVYELRGIYLTQRMVKITPQVTTLGDTVLKDVSDDMLVHFAPGKALPNITKEGIKNPNGGMNFFFRVGDVRARGWNLTQAKGAVGSLAESGLDISGACIVDPKNVPNLMQSRNMPISFSASCTSQIRLKTL